MINSDFSAHRLHVSVFRLLAFGQCYLFPTCFPPSLQAITGLILCCCSLADGLSFWTPAHQRIKHVKGRPSFSPPYEASTVFRQVLDISCYFSCSFLQLKPAKAFHSTHSHKEHAIEEDNNSCKAHLIFDYFVQKMSCPSCAEP